MTQTSQDETIVVTATDRSACDQEAIVRAAVANLAGRVTVDAHAVEVTVRRFVGEWFEQARVKTFVGIIAERHARMELQQIQVRPEPEPRDD